MDSNERELRFLPGELPVPGRRRKDGRLIVCRPDREEERSALGRLWDGGFRACPEYLGLDGQGGAYYALPPGQRADEGAEFSEKQFLSFMRLLRRMHDAGAQEKGERVICHRALSPEHVLFDPPHGHLGSLPCAIVDWDACYYGRRWEDVVYVCWRWLGIGSPARDDGKILRQIDKGLDAYSGGDEALSREVREDFDGRICARMESVAFEAELRGENLPALRRRVTDGQQWVFRHRPALRAMILPDRPAW
ncbi:MAG TPA: phosphotransferase [Firmicutes bacterium]|nr:phosphotransferase [Bacillota bacterium]